MYPLCKHITSISCKAGLHAGSPHFLETLLSSGSFRTIQNRINTIARIGNMSIGSKKSREYRVHFYLWLKNPLTTSAKLLRKKQDLSFMKIGVHRFHNKGCSFNAVALLSILSIFFYFSQSLHTPNLVTPHCCQPALYL